MEYNMEYKKLDKKAERCMRVNEIILSVTLTAIILPLDFIFLMDVSKMAGYSVLGLVILLDLFSIILVPKYRYERYRYMVNDQVIKVKTGFIWVKETIIPVEKLHKIELAQGPIDRIFGLSSITVITAGGEGVIAFLSPEESEQLADRLKDKINEIAVEERLRQVQ